ncbi:MAG TPA: hypothetical protein VK054_04490, partial [Beutenbergiaceae bacterium]|nr:hypothetical protein [Beutenbergiaceae bacterium]
VIAQSAAPISLLPGPALQSGRAELLTFLREQVVSAQGCRLGVEGRLEATPQERTQHTSA